MSRSPRNARTIDSSTVVVLTGASEGIGAACARAFAARGAQLSLNARNAERLEALNITDALLTPGDITHPVTRETLIGKTISAFGRIDILINNAGAGIYWPPSVSPEEETRRLFELNVFAPLALTQLTVPYMRVRRSGTIVNVSSIAGKITLPWMTIYSATKSALSTITDGFRMELAPFGVHAMSVYPGYVQTEFHQHAIGKNPPASIVRGRRFAITADQCAADILRGIERQARAVVTPRWGWAFMAANLLAPGVVENRLNNMNGGIVPGRNSRPV
jgi:short-subunit dehydrogenase